MRAHSPLVRYITCNVCLRHKWHGASVCLWLPSCKRLSNKLLKLDALRYSIPSTHKNSIWCLKVALQPTAQLNTHRKEGWMRISPIATDSKVLCKIFMCTHFSQFFKHDGNATTECQDHSNFLDTVSRKSNLLHSISNSKNLRRKRVQNSKDNIFVMCTHSHNTVRA